MSGNVATFVLFGVALLIVFPFAVGGMSEIFGAKWGIIIISAVLGGSGMLLFNGMIAGSTSQNIGTLFVLMIITQIVIPAIYQVVVGGLTITKGVGFALAAIAGVLLVL